MTHFMDDLRYDYSRPEARALRDLLKANFRRRADIERLVDDAGLDAAELNLQQSAAEIWHELLPYARRMGAHYQLIATARKQLPALRQPLDELMSASKPTYPDEEEPLAPSCWAHTRDDTHSLERQLGENSTLLDIAFLHKAIKVASGVLRVTAEHRDAHQNGTAFRIAPDLILTNHHVICRHGVAADRLSLDLGHEVDIHGTENAGRTVTLDPVEVVASEHNPALSRDWAVIRWPGAPPPDEVSILRLGSHTPPRPGERAYIIQHPGGGPKQIGLNRNLIRHVDDNVVQYLTDTEPGSSGSPVCNEDWEVISLHYRWIKAPRERYRYRNQGMRIEPIVAALHARGLLPQAHTDAPHWLSAAPAYASATP
ncbi:MAG: hypothetical protein Tsb0020_08410 [Haliangiales bacterium]